MLKSEMQHQFWVTKKAVQRKLGSKEDECIISSDAELDTKLGLLKSVSASCCSLYKIIDQFQERVCILSQEENSFGKFLKEAGKKSNTTSSNLIATGKAISYCGQQRMSIRIPLIRLHHEVEVFQCRAVFDTQVTINTMEKERTEYRAALSWMKSASLQLDPDTGKGLDKFRKSQNHVRLSKAKFDRLSMDCIQKIDLLVAARCNMFSHALVAYMKAFSQFTKKASDTLKIISTSLSDRANYDFCILKDLSQKRMSSEECDIVSETGSTADPDKSMFFSDEYVDEEQVGSCISPEPNFTFDLISILESSPSEKTNTANIDMLFTKSYDDAMKIKNNICMHDEGNKSNTKSTSELVQADLIVEAQENPKEHKSERNEMASGSNAICKPSWLQLFSELDILSNSDIFAQNIIGDTINSQDA